jgi:malonate-semialdehyde dehydrogenase (acetylating)/methylmalonate-semialdehyde dehydrogenase
VILGTPDDLQQAVDAALRAQPARLGRHPAGEARPRVDELLESSQRDRDALAAAITEEHGKVLDDARGEVMRGIEIVEFAAGLAPMLKGDFTEQVAAGIP